MAEVLQHQTMPEEPEGNPDAAYQWWATDVAGSLQHAIAAAAAAPAGTISGEQVSGYRPCGEVAADLQGLA